jgi:hypothetical protein
MLGDLSDRSQTMGLNWSLADAWSLDVSAGLSNTVMGQGQRQKTLGLNYMFHPRALVSLTWSDSSSDALINASGVTVSPSQSDSSVDMSLRWLF